MQQIVISKFGETIKLHREQFQWSQEYLGKKLHVSQSVVSRWETGEREPSLKQAKEIARILGVSLDSF